MPFDEEADDERPDSGVPLPPEDRLWRHPSELGPGGSGLVPDPTNPLSAPWPPLPVVGRSRRGLRGRRKSFASVAAVSCLVGAVIAMGVVIATRPSSPAISQQPEKAAQPSALQPITSVVWKQFPTERVAAAVTPAVARLDVRGAKGWQQPASAVLLDDAGTLVTSSALVRGSQKIVVTFANDVPRTGRLAGVDSQTGIAVITVAPQGHHAADLAGTRPSTGEPTLMVGGPGPGSVTGTVTTGNVRGLGRQTDGVDGTLHDLIEIDRPVLDDTTGGALVDADGQVLGICLKGKTAALGYAVPIDLVRKVGAEIRTKGRVSWGRLGVKAADLDPGQAQDLGLSGAAQVVSVEPASPAAKAGLVTGDLITLLGMTKIESVTDLVAALSEHHPGDELEVQYRRGSQSRSVETTLGTN